MRPDTRSMLAVFTTVALAAAPCVSFAKEYPVGTPVDVAGMEIGAVYLQPIKMDPPDIMAPAAATDIHLEADIHALADNAGGFAEGAWMPYLRITYELTKAGGKTITGKLMPMVASDGPHYGDNVKLDGVGKYHLTFTIEAPGPEFGRHVDKETGVPPWFKPLTTSYDFVFAGVGKIGSY
ncbi:iron transporter [Allgaiera indica]|uniref:34 kDa membrane antigen n=2 Tax=Allgaiera indica TaxID=765699 RepID=A0A1H3AZE6_9RHOB|nr:iron transporter [Allgaiera indica]SDX34494.1 hypothetical protein SAMN05444006_11439 [Allgaiera indica]